MRATGLAPALTYSALTKLVRSSSFVTSEGQRITWSTLQNNLYRSHTQNKALPPGTMSQQTKHSTRSTPPKDTGSSPNQRKAGSKILSTWENTHRHGDDGGQGTAGNIFIHSYHKHKDSTGANTGHATKSADNVGGH